jgi:AbrB family looped-hinge helix DNA binding protein
MAAATLTSKGQLTVPKAVRDALRLRTGDKVEFTVRDGESALLVRPRRIDALSLFGMFKHKRKRRPVTVREMDEGIGRAVSAEHWKSVGKPRK